MPLDAKAGTKVALWKPQNGYPSDKERLARLGIKRFQVFTVKQTDIGQSHTTVYLAEFPGERFNSVNWATF